MRQQRMSLDRAAEWIANIFDAKLADLAPAVDSIRREGARNKLLDSPPGVLQETAAEARMSSWYSGSEEGDELWPRLESRIKSGPMADVVTEIDNASTKVVANLADPSVYGLRKRGLVVGYVQSGKTANYTAVMAKAADAGYGLFIVLSGMYDNLRRQTQVRLSRDIVDHDWVPLTTDDADFGNVVNGAAFLARGTKSIAVVKKNQARLRSLRDWLRDIPQDIRRRVPVLLLDDEADQATPNSATRQDRQTRINRLIRQIWQEIPTGTYLGYTATPFANIFMDPNDDQELYPADFIIDLPRPKAYFGAERVFGREPLNDADDPDPGLDMVRDVPDEEAKELRPPSNREARQTFDPALPPSLIEAIRWFLVATAIRRARAQHDAHSSMLIHTTHYIQPHIAMQGRVQALISTIRADWQDGNIWDLDGCYRREAMRAKEVASVELPAWSKVKQAIARVLSDVRILVDNGESDDRLDYDRVVDGKPVPETVIAVGGGTLSRGLTLEGLVVSYFTRTSNTYDTLLQMGRWFGYRTGYEDLTRIWMQASLAEEFRFLALVEHEIRQDMAHMERMQVTPRQLGVRVRAHPGRLAIVARNKMQHADIVRITYAGRRLQTFIFDELGRSVIARNQDAAKELVTSCRKVVPERQILGLPRWIFTDIPAQQITSFLKTYQFHPDQVGLHGDHMIGWIERAAPSNPWNVVVIGSDKIHRRDDNSPIPLGEMDLGLPMPVPAVNRAPLRMPEPGTANIKALLSHNDWFADLPPGLVAELGESSADPRTIRRERSKGRGLLIIYPVSCRSTPMGPARKTNSRRDMQAPDHLIGVGIIFPEVEQEGLAKDGTYYSVHPDWEVEAVDEEDLPQDREGSHIIDGHKVGIRP
ncbi:Z1 domain-containing protein [Solwaraspora sp. WMMD937]|uniref:Z1 domain-containing protein n=1 Tax=Solwaraspora sp. WMMD937 TaxID=3016090 RepID=UPI00249AC5D2|nr:Z1 domain-containing protein [Solwaraspora sp. WMMD937]WFE23305.1 Z1 domain-containing protein [Solwaraspora sp. WMMD937]